MTRKKVKLAWVTNENARTISLKKRRQGLMKKVRELTILCDVKACLVMFSPNEVEPMVWPSPEGARDLLHDFFALPEIQKKRKETNLEQYLKEKTKKVHDQMVKNHKKNTKLKVDQLMMQLQGGRKNDDLNLSEIYDLLPFLYSSIMLIRKRLGSMQHPPLRQPPVRPSFEAQSEELRSNTNNVFVGGRQEGARGGRIDGVKNICIDNARENQTRYLMDQWVFSSPDPPNHRSHQQNSMERTSYNVNPYRTYLPYQGSSSNGASNLEMEPTGSRMMNFPGMVRPVSHPLQHHNMNINPNMVMSQPRQYPFNFMSGVKEEQSNINDDGSQFHMSNYNGSIRQEPPLDLNGTSREEDKADAATSFDINRNWTGPHF